MRSPFFWIDIIVFLLLLVSLLAGLLTLGREPSLLRGKLKFTSTITFAIAFLTGGVDSIVTLNYAPRSNFNGTITSLINHGGKNPTCTLQVIDGPITQITVTESTFTGDFSCYGLHVGDEVHLVWMRYNAHIVRMDIMGGPDRGEFRRGGDPLASALGIALGLFLLYAAQRELRTNPTATPKTRKQKPPPSDIDDASLLNLNSHRQRNEQ